MSKKKTRGIDALTQSVREAEERRKAEQEKRKRDVIDVRLAPTPEQQQHAPYVDKPFNDRDLDGRLVLRRAHRRQARFETIEGLTPVQLRALRLYRQAFDETEISEVKSQLDVRTGGGGGGSDAMLTRVERMASGAVALMRIESRVPAHLLTTLRAVALHDRDFKAVAIERWGSRTVQRIDSAAKKPRVTSSLEPRSGRHRERVRAEFMEGAAILAAGLPRSNHRALPAATCDVSSEQAPAAVDPAFLDEHGRMRPLNEVRQIILERFASVDEGEAQA